MLQTGEITLARNETPTAAEWNRRLAPHRKPHLGRSLWQIANTAIPFAALWYAMLASLSLSYAVTLLLSVPTAMLLVRLFIIQHDCGHGSFFESKRASEVLGSVIGVLTLTPYHYWKREHAIHHATSGMLDRRGHGDIDTLTVEEYRARSRFGRFRYRLYRHPLMLFVLGPAIQFLLLQRLPLQAPPSGRTGWLSVLGTNLGIAALAAVMILVIGFERFLLVQLPVTLVASSLGVWLFYIQHQFEGTYWRRKPDWDYADAALRGSSFYDLGPVLQWFSGNIGIHHVHHLNSGIPNYRLERCLREFPELRDVKRLTFLESLKCARLTLWDEEEQRLVGFAGARRREPVAA